MFSIDDYKLLTCILTSFRSRHVTPNVLTEVSNLASQLDGNKQQVVFEVLRSAVAVLKEHYVPSQHVTQQKEFFKFGLTDAALVLLTRKRLLLLTMDFPLANYCSSIGADVINFTNLRPLTW